MNIRNIFQCDFCGKHNLVILSANRIIESRDMQLCRHCRATTIRKNVQEAYVCKDVIAIAVGDEQRIPIIIQPNVAVRNSHWDDFLREIDNVENRSSRGAAFVAELSKPVNTTLEEKLEYNLGLLTKEEWDYMLESGLMQKLFGINRTFEEHQQTSDAYKVVQELKKSLEGNISAYQAIEILTVQLPRIIREYVESQFEDKH